MSFLGILNLRRNVSVSLLSLLWAKDTYIILPVYVKLRQPSKNLVLVRSRFYLFLDLQANSVDSTQKLDEGGPVQACFICE